MSKVEEAREWLNKNSAVVTIATIFALVMALAYIVWFSGGGGPVVVEEQRVYFYDLKAQDGSLATTDLDNLYPMESDAMPPVKSPTGNGMLENGMPGGVRAHVYGCGGCGPDKDRFIGYLSFYGPEAHKLKNELPPEEERTTEDQWRLDDAMELSRIIAMPGDSRADVPDNFKGRWVPRGSEPGSAIIASMMQVDPPLCPNEEEPIPCGPDG
ncbi:MAG: hypothetical protein R3336_03470 [Phycisphaeraceae bacterium]|nr:hypothetical protein [Phycisphaeraceae bacterium]